MSEYIERGALRLAAIDAPWRDSQDEDVFYDTLDSTPAADVVEVKPYCDALNALADMVNQFAYSTTFYGKEAVCDGGLSALENAFWVLEQAGCKVNSNGTIQRANLFRFMDKMDGGADNG